MKILGTKFYGHDNSVFYLDTVEKKIFGLSNERVTRIKHDRASIRATVEAYPFLKDVDCVVSGYELEDRKKYYLDLAWYDFIYEVIQPKYIKSLVIVKKSSLTNVKLFLKLFGRSRKYHAWLWDSFMFKTLKRPMDFRLAREKIDQYYADLLEVPISKIDHKDHHLCHAMSSYAFSPFAEGEDVISFTLDGIGDFAFSKVYKFKSFKDYECLGVSVAETVKGSSHKFTSIGFLYSDFTRALDLIPNSDEGKVEALAAYAEPDIELLDRMKAMVSIDELAIKINPDEFGAISSQPFLRQQRERLGDKVFSSTVQTWLEDVVVEYLNRVHERTGITKICFSGGVAANIIMSLNVYERTPFKEIYVFPAMADDGVAAGAAILKAVERGESVAWLKERIMPYFGDSFSSEQVLEVLNARASQIVFENLESSWPEHAAQSVANGKVISLFHGREEYGPRALGNRSIVANARDPDVTRRINSTVKRRPEYQPFCPSILEEEREKLFEASIKHKHMAIAFRMKPDYWNDLPSAIHVDGTARPQFVEAEDNPNYYRLIKAVKEHTGYGVVINTSFNLHGRTMVHTPDDAITDFIDCNIDELYIEGFKVTRKD